MRNAPLTGDMFPQTRHPQADVIEAYLRMGGATRVIRSPPIFPPFSYRFVFCDLGLEVQGPWKDTTDAAYDLALINLSAQLWGPFGIAPEGWKYFLVRALPRDQ